MKLTALTTALVIIAVLAASGVSARSWMSATTTGLTTVTWSLTGNTYTWTLTNSSGSAAGGQSATSILAWSLQPFLVPSPVSWTAPDGWEWGGEEFQSFRLIDNFNKHTAPAVAPGESVSFTYTFDPTLPKVNTNGPQPDDMAFISHVGAVEAAPVEDGGVIRWIPASPDYGDGWHDAAAGYHQQSAHAPEPSGILACVIGGAWLATHLHRNGKRLARNRFPA